MAWVDYEKRHAELQNIRAIDEPRWRDISRLMQADQSFGQTGRDNRSDGDDPFDSTPLYAADDFVNGIFTKAVNPAERWFEWSTPSDPDLQKWKPARDYLWKYTNLIYTSLDPTIDKFYLNAPAWFADLAMWGSGFEWQEEIAGEGRIITPNMPLAQCYKDVDANGDTDTFHRRMRLTGRQARAKWPGNAALSLCRDDEQITFVHVIMPNPDYRPGNPFSRYMRYKSVYVSPDKRDFIVEGGFHEFPVHEIEWSPRSGRTWARGPAHNALPDMRTNDEVARSTLVGIQFDAEPTWWAANEDVMTLADIQPGNILYGEGSSNGKPPVQILERAKQMQLPLQVQQDLRNQVRRAFRFSLSQVLAMRPQMTAEEVQAYTNDELKSLAPNLVRIHRGLGSFIRRRAQILDRMGAVVRQIGLPPPELQRANVAVTFVSPFAKAQKADIAAGATSWVSTKLQMFAATQDLRWIDDIDIDGYSELLHDARSGVPSIKLDPKIVEQNRQARVQAQAQQTQLIQAEQAAGVYADVSHADQAKTLAKGRAQR